MDYAKFMNAERHVIDCLMEEHQLEESVVLQLIEDHGDELREYTMLGYDEEVIANELASYVSK